MYFYPKSNNCKWIFFSVIFSEIERSDSWKIILFYANIQSFISIPKIIFYFWLGKKFISFHFLQAAGLSKLRYLNLSGNGINEIDLAAFAKLNDLSVLDLSKNHLNYILTDTFVTNGKLKILKLQQNNFNLHVPKLRSSTITVIIFILFKPFINIYSFKRRFFIFNLKNFEALFKIEKL